MGRRRNSSKASTGLIALLAAITVALFAVVIPALWRGSRQLWAKGRAGQATVIGGCLAALGLAFALFGGGAPSMGNTSTAYSNLPASTARPTATEYGAGTTAPTETAEPTPTLAEPSPTPGVTGQALNGGNIRAEPQIVASNVLAQLDAHDEVVFLAAYRDGNALWYQITVAKGKNKGVTGWVSSTLLSIPDSELEVLADVITTPTTGAGTKPVTVKATAKPASKPAPTTKPAPPARPAPTSAPPTGARTGARCRDGTRSDATGRGACSHHGGVAYWLYE